MILLADQNSRAIRAFVAALTLSAALGLAATPATAQKKPDPKVAGKATGKAGGTPGGNSPSPLATFGEWGAYTAGAGKGRTCYALSKPGQRAPANLKRDPAYVFISNRPGEGVKNEVSIIMGFDVKADAAATADVGSNSFEMVAKAANLWVKNPAKEGEFIEALRKGQRLVVKASSKKDNVTTDTYTLAGLLPAMDRIGKECP